jgi:hypothetical protein
MPFIVAAIIFPTLLVLISMGVRRFRGAPVTSAADFVCLAIVFDGLVIATSAEVLPHLNIGYAPETAVADTMVLLGISFAVWSFCLYEVEPRIAGYYIERKPFARLLLFATWAMGLAVIVLQISFFTGRVATWFSRAATWFN